VFEDLQIMAAARAQHHAVGVEIDLAGEAVCRRMDDAQLHRAARKAHG